MPRFTFEKFPGAEPLLTTSMKSVGEAMAIGRSFAEVGAEGAALDGDRPHRLRRGRDRRRRRAPTRGARGAGASRRPTACWSSRRRCAHGLAVEEIHAVCKYDPWFLREIERDRRGRGSRCAPTACRSDAAACCALKKLGFSDARLAELAEHDRGGGRRAAARGSASRPVYKRIDTCAAEFASRTPYMYSSYEGDGAHAAGVRGRADRPATRSIILGGGPNRIGQGIEFDYCCVHAAYALREAGFETIMVNCNPETVSTDYDTSDRLYFEPLTAEDVIELVRVEQRRGTLLGVIVQFGGQTPLKLAAALEAAGIPILGTSPDAIDLAEDRERFQELLQQARAAPAGQRHRPLGRRGRGGRRARIGYPVVIRPSYVLGGRAMEIVHDDAGAAPLHDARGEGLRQEPGADRPLPAGRHRGRRRRASPTAATSIVAGIMEHIEEAGIHSGDSACSLPPYSLPPDVVAEIERQTEALARALDVVGLMNVQFAVKDGDDLRARGQPARLPHRAVRRQGDRRADRQDRGARHGRREARATSELTSRAPATTSRSRRRCSRSPASPASTSSSGRR